MFQMPNGRMCGPQDLLEAMGHLRMLETCLSSSGLWNYLAHSSLVCICCRKE